MGSPGGGRLVDEPASGLRSTFQRDRDRVVHSTSFRRLEYKTQVLVNFEGDHFRTRLTHSLEVAQIARTLSRVLGLDEDLAEALALAHDLGHSPFGHAGEWALDAALRPFGGFDHNVQTFRVVTRLEQRYALFDGLNLSVETLEGLAKHNGPLPTPSPAIADHPLAAAMQLALQPPLEAQISAIADDVAYCNHDMDDGLRAGFFTLADLRDLPVVGAVVREVETAHPAVDARRLIHETNRRLIDRMVADLVAETERRLAETRPRSVQDVREAGRPLAGFSAEMTTAVGKLRHFLHARMYRHYKVNRMARKAQRLVTELVGALLHAPDCLPDRWQQRAGAPGSAATADAVRDYVAGMTDRYAVDEHDRLFKLAGFRS
ncbi:MAG: deoxyguanosinetriphosphate triphosphohydrolase [Geminicoccaceae bacterium]|jgi:dGTPase|nr:deoxyguanosinetriphosphate triphosphohydrolase [Geminicoccaceae bacterium]